MTENKDTTFYGFFVIISSGGILLTYSFVDADLQVGQLVCVPLRHGKSDKTSVAVFVKFCEKPTFECRAILSLFPHSIMLKKGQLDIINRVATYYLAPLEWCVRLVAPGFLWQANKISILTKYFEKMKDQLPRSNCGVTADHVTTRLSVVTPRSSVVTPRLDRGAHEIILNSKQQEIFDFILKNLDQSILLHGVTGSGKTEIYLTVAQHIIKSGKNCLILVPEITLAPQMASRFRSVFGDMLNVLHSGISQVSLMKEWLSVYFGKARVVLGVRSAIFCPLENIGLIVVDEEHDQSYKCSEKPCYNARDVAVMRAKQEGACCILGSATPSLESFYNTKVHKYKYIELANKHQSSTQVSTLIFETQKSAHSFKLSGMDSQNCQIANGILDLIRKNNAEQFKTIVLLNRRGFVNYALCDACRTPLSCPHCSVATTIHNFGKREICHYCDFNTPMRKFCPLCNNEHFLLKGIGTQNIESFLQKEMPDLRLERLDRDTLTSHTRLTKILSRFAGQETNCLVGTQILAKGHDFAKVTLIVILNLEDGLFLPDFRAAEKTFHLLTQAMGRVGRDKYPGVVALQSLVKSHPVIDYALRNDVKLFLERELKNRQRAVLPPYTRLILLEIKHEQKILAEKYAQTIKKDCLAFWKKNNLAQADVFLSGPHDAPIEKINDVYRLHICVHMAKSLHPHHCIPERIYTSVQWKNILKIDVDPQNFM